MAGEWGLGVYGLTVYGGITVALGSSSNPTPAMIWTGGQMVTLSGTGFRVPTIPVGPFNGPTPALKPTVRVTIDGVESDKVLVYSSTELDFKAPEHDPGTVSIVVTNLDDNGNAIPGETVTLTNVLQYVRPDLTANSDYARVTDELVKKMRRQILDNVSVFVSTDWGESPYEVAAPAKLPAILLTAPDAIEARGVYARSSALEVDGPTSGDYEERRIPPVVHLQYEFVVLTNNGRQLTNLQVLMRQFFDRNPKIRIQKDASDVSKGYIEYEMRVPLDTSFKNTTTPNKNNISSFSGNFTIYGVAIEGIAGFTKEDLVKRGGVVDNVVITAGAFVSD